MVAAPAPVEDVVLSPTPPVAVLEVECAAAEEKPGSDPGSDIEHIPLKQIRLTKPNERLLNGLACLMRYGRDLVRNYFAMVLLVGSQAGFVERCYDGEMTEAGHEEKLKTADVDLVLVFKDPNNLSIKQAIKETICIFLRGLVYLVGDQLPPETPRFPRNYESLKVSGAGISADLAVDVILKFLPSPLDPEICMRERGVFSDTATCVQLSDSYTSQYLSKDPSIVTLEGDHCLHRFTGDPRIIAAVPTIKVYGYVIARIIIEHSRGDDRLLKCASLMSMVKDVFSSSVGSEAWNSWAEAVDICGKKNIDSRSIMDVQCQLPLFAQACVREPVVSVESTLK